MVGPATAAAVLAFAYSKPAVYLETNVRRVYIYFFFEGRDGVRDKEIVPLAASALDRQEPKQWHYALMDYGVALKGLPVNPNRQSRHYAVQSPFEGSDRQIRGEILRLLVKKAPAGLDELAGLLPFERDRVEKAIASLENDGMVVKEDAVYRIG
jgi:A/G-specific adenine glycosylase